MMARGGKMDEAVFREKLKNMGQVRILQIFVKTKI
jgi:hypothetical protein